MSLHKLTWASALPSDLGKAMREASERRMATDTDSHVFSFSNHLVCEGKPSDSHNTHSNEKVTVSLDGPLVSGPGICPRGTGRHTASWR